MSKLFIANPVSAMYVPNYTVICYNVLYFSLSKDELSPSVFIIRSHSRTMVKNCSNNRRY